MVVGRQELPIKDQCRYLGVEISKHRSYDAHVEIQVEKGKA